MQYFPCLLTIVCVAGSGVVHACVCVCLVVNCFSRDFFDVVVVTARDEQQQALYQRQLQAKKDRKEIPCGCKCVRACVRACVHKFAPLVMPGN